MRFRVQPAAGPARGIDLYLFEEREGRVHAVQPLAISEEPVGDIVIEPTTRISEEDAAQLMTDLWNAGVRPTIPAPGEKLVAAKDLHIQHLYEIALKAMDLSPQIAMRAIHEA